MTDVLHDPVTPAPPARGAAAAQPVGGSGPAASDRLRSLVVGTSLLAVMGMVTFFAARPLGNTDTWFHLSIGRHLLGSWSLRHPGHLSSFGDAPWVPTQWSSELLMALADRWWGLPGVAWVYGAAYLAVVVAVYAVCRRQADALVATVVTAVAVCAAAPALSARPQVVTLALLAVVAASWLEAQRSGRVPWLLVPLTWAWATAHGMWTTGVVVGVICCAGVLVDRRPARRRALALCSVPVLSLVAACLTPLGPALLTGQLAVGQRAAYISEWAPTSFRQPAALAFAVMAAGVVVCWSLRGGVSWTRLLLLLFACGEAALVTRMVTCAAVLVAPLLAAELQLLVRAPAGTRCPWPRSERLVVLGGAAVMLAALAVAVPHTAARPAHVPSAFDARLASLPAGSPIAVEDGIGSWIELRHPDLAPLQDGMFDAYPVGYLKRAAGMVNVQPGWQRFLAGTGAHDAVLVSGSTLYDAVRHQLHWRVVQRSAGYAYLVAPAGTGLAKTD